MPTATTTSSPLLSSPLLIFRSPSLGLVLRAHAVVAHTAARQFAAWAPLLRAAVAGAALLLAALAALAGPLLGAVAAAAHWHLWAAPAAERLRKKLCFELALAVLGPGGNGVLLVVLWPGWVVVGGAAWGVWAVAG